MLKPTSIFYNPFPWLIKYWTKFCLNCHTIFITNSYQRIWNMLSLSWNWSNTGLVIRCRRLITEGPQALYCHLWFVLQKIGSKKIKGFPFLKMKNWANQLNMQIKLPYQYFWQWRLQCLTHRVVLAKVNSQMCQISHGICT